MKKWIIDHKTELKIGAVAVGGAIFVAGMFALGMSTERKMWLEVRDAKGVVLAPVKKSTEVGFIFAGGSDSTTCGRGLSFTPDEALKIKDDIERVLDIISKQKEVLS